MKLDLKRRPTGDDANATTDSNASNDTDETNDANLVIDDVDGLDDADLQASEPVEVRRDGPLAAMVGLLGCAVGVAYLLRAVGSGSALDWAICAATSLIGLTHVWVLADSRAPLMVLDEYGVRIRRGATWRGVSWPEVDLVEHRPRESLLRDGSLAVTDVEGSTLSVRLSMSTRLVGANWHELSEALDELTEGACRVVEVTRTARDVDPDPAVVLDEVPEGPDGTDGVELAADEQPVIASPTPEPTREISSGRRVDASADVVTSGSIAPAVDETAVRLSAADELTTAGVAEGGDSVTLVITDAEALRQRAVEPMNSVTPVIGPVLRQARDRVGLSTDQLAARTRIRPHVIEAMEHDDFAPCGGDFYARGHLQTLARVLGLEAAPLLREYDERYSDAPVDARSVFEAELASGGRGIRATRGGLNWSVLVAAVMAAILVWSVARLVMDGPAPLADQPVLNGSPGKAALSGSNAKKVPVEFTATTGGAAVIVRDGKQQVVFDERLAFMQTATVEVVPPVRISSTDGGLTVTIDGDAKGALGETGQDAQDVFVP